MTYRHTIRLSLCLPHKDGQAPIRMRVSWDCQRTDVRTGIAVQPLHWDAKRERVKLSHPDCAQLNSDLLALCAAVDALFAKAYDTMQPPTPQQVHKAVTRRRRSGVDEMTLDELVRQFIEFKIRRAEWQPTTLRTFQTLLVSIRDFRPDWPLSDVNEATVDEYVSTLRLNNASFNHTMSQLRSVVQWAVDNGQAQPVLVKPFRRHLKTVTNEPLALTANEVKAIMAVELPPSVAEIRDAFVFQCLTGLRHSDVRRIRWVDIRDGVLHLVDKKTSDAAVIPLNTPALALLANRDHNTATVFTVGRTEVYNRTLRRICKLAGITGTVTHSDMVGNRRHDRTIERWQAVSSHTGRRTFVTIAAALGIAPEVISQWTGHNQLATMQRYLAVSTERAAAEMSKFAAVVAPEKNPKYFQN